MKFILNILLIAIALIILLFAVNIANAEAPTLPAAVIEVSSKAPTSLVSYAYDEVSKKWSEDEWKSFEDLIDRESGWKVTGAHYPSGYAQVKQPDGTFKTVKSSAYGLGGFLDATWKSTGIEKTDDPYRQIDAIIIYINDNPKYGTPTKAIAYHDRENSY